MLVDGIRDEGRLELLAVELLQPLHRELVDRIPCVQELNALLEHGLKGGRLELSQPLRGVLVDRIHHAQNLDVLLEQGMTCAPSG